MKIQNIVLFIILIIVNRSVLLSQQVAYPVEDVYVNNTDTPNPNATRLYVSNGGSGGDQITYLKFQVPEFSGRLINSMLELGAFGDARGKNGVEVQIFACSNTLSDGTNWKQEDISNGNKPQIGLLLDRVLTRSYSPSMDDPTVSTHKFNSPELLAYLQKAIPGEKVSLAIKTAPTLGETSDLTGHFIYNSKESNAYQSRIWFYTDSESPSIITENDPLYWQCNWNEKHAVNYITIGGSFGVGSQSDTNWKVQYRDAGDWVTIEEGVGGWIDGGVYQWGGIEQSPVALHDLRVIFYGDEVKSLNLSGRGGSSILIDDRETTIKATLIQWVGDALSNPDTSLENIDMYPIPIATNLFFKGLSVGQLIQLYSEEGALLQKLEVTKPTEYISFQGMAKGIYIVKINSAESQAMLVRKVLKK